MQFWYPTKKEIQDWLETKETEFTEKENKNPRLSIEAWLDKYIFTDEHEVFFASLPSELHEWLSKLAETKCYTQSDKPAEWTPEAIEVLKKSGQLYQPSSRLLDHQDTRRVHDRVRR